MVRTSLKLVFIEIEIQNPPMESQVAGIEEQSGLVDLEYNNGVCIEEEELGIITTDESLKDVGDLRALKRGRRIISQLTKPSTTLLLGPKGNLRHESRIRLRYLLDRIVRRRNWRDAAGVLTVLLKGTCKERSLHDNRLKYTVAMELLEHVGIDREESKYVEDIHDLWSKKIVPKKNGPLKDRYVIFDSIFYFLEKEDYDKARSSALSLTQDHAADEDPISNLILGLCYYELWYAKLPIERRLKDINESEMLDENEESGTELHNSSDNQAVSVQDTNSILKYPSETSIRNDKVIQMDNLNRKETHHQLQVQGLHTDSDQMSRSEGGYFIKRNINMQCSPAFDSNGVPSSLLFPVKWDPSTENIETVLENIIPNDDYKDAVKYLRKSLNSTPGVAEALLPLVQILLLNDCVKEALDELEKFAYASKSLFASRLKTHYFESRGCNNPELLFSCYEDILKKDPTCKHSLARLVHAYQMGDYSPEPLLEMIALHLEATFGDHDIWREFASCIMKVSQCEEDWVSTCLNGGDAASGERRSESKKTPTMFVKGELAKKWKLRCKWWLNRHFSKKLLASEITGGNLSLMAYKAACASQIYGPGFDYVVKAGAALKEEENPLFMVLSMYVQSSSGFYSELVGGSKWLSSWQEVFGEKARTKRGRPKGASGKYCIQLRHRC